MWLNIPAFPFNLVSEMIVGTRREQPGPVITTDAPFIESQQVHGEKRAAKNNLGSRRMGGMWEEIWECSRTGRHQEARLRWSRASPARGTATKSFIWVYNHFYIILYHFYIVFWGVMGAQSTGAHSASGEDAAAPGDDAKGGERRENRLGWVFFFLCVSSAIRIIRPQIIEGWWCG